MSELVNMAAILKAAAPIKNTHSVKKGSVEDRKMQQACEDFESLLINQMLQQMRQTVPHNELFGGGRAEQLYTSMLDGELAKTMSHQRGIGLSPMLFQQLKSISDKAKK
jgi:Rod binding domain-containing protein